MEVINAGIPYEILEVTDESDTDMEKIAENIALNIDCLKTIYRKKEESSYANGIDDVVKKTCQYTYTLARRIY